MENKLKIAVGIIIILLLIIVYTNVIIPQYDKYNLNKKREIQQETIKIITDIIKQQIKQQGYIVIGEGEDAIILIEYPTQNTGDNLK